MGTNFSMLAAGTAPTGATPGGGVVTVAMPVILIALAVMALANRKAPRFAGFCLFVAGVGLSGTALAASLSQFSYNALTGTVTAFTGALS